MQLKELNRRLSEYDFSIHDVVNFYKKEWAKIIIVTAIGAFLGFAYWHIFSVYTAVGSLNNLGGVQTSNWHSLQKSLPSLANQVNINRMAPDEELVSYGFLSNGGWWQKNVIPTFSVSKSELKEISGQLGAEAVPNAQILSINFQVSGESHESALENLNTAFKFFRNGVSYLSLKNWLNGLESDLVFSRGDIEKRVSEIKAELPYQQKRLKNLEELLKRFPVNSRNDLQIVDTKDSTAKYMPLPSQIVALKIEMQLNEDNLVRLAAKTEQVKLQSQILDALKQTMLSTIDVNHICKKFLDILDDIQERQPPEALSNIAYLSEMRSIVLQHQAKFSFGFSENIGSTVSRPTFIKPIFIGMILAVSLLLFFLVVNRLLDLTSSKVK